VSQSRQETISRLLRDVGAGDREAFDRLVPLVYDELREVARRQRRRWQGDDTLGTTALIHEAYLRLAGQSGTGWTSLPHFHAVASRAVRQVLLDYAKGQHAAKRGGALHRVPLEEIEEALARISHQRANFTSGSARETSVIVLRENAECFGLWRGGFGRVTGTEAPQRRDFMGGWRLRGRAVAPGGRGVGRRRG